MNSNNKLGILVVHGIGSPPPGDTLARFADALEVEGYITHREDLVDERRRSLPESHRKDFRKRLIRGGPMPVQRAYGYADLKNKKNESDSTGANSKLPPVIFAEAFWSDITQLPGGIAGVLRGYFDIFFNLITLIKTAVPVAPSKDGFTEGEIKKTPKLVAQETEAKNELLLVRLFSRISRITCILISGPIASANLLIILIFIWMWLCAPIFFSGDDLFIFKESLQKSY